MDEVDLIVYVRLIFRVMKIINRRKWGIFTALDIYTPVIEIDANDCQLVH
jgi:hypothetical protein